MADALSAQETYIVVDVEAAGPSPDGYALLHRRVHAGLAPGDLLRRA
jgi:hypothetical protein